MVSSVLVNVEDIETAKAIAGADEAPPPSLPAALTALCVIARLHHRAGEPAALPHQLGKSAGEPSALTICCSPPSTSA